MKTAQASTTLEVWVQCPNCNRYQDKTNKLKEHLEDGLSAENIDVETRCQNAVCEELFLVTSIEY